MRGTDRPVQVCILTSVHDPFDLRVFHKEARSLSRAGYDVTVIAPSEFTEHVCHGVRVLGVTRPQSRRERPKVWWRLLCQVIQLRPHVVHFHDPELLLLVPLLHLVFRRHVKIIYDVHEYFVDSLAGKYWVPHWLRPAAMFAARWGERLLVRGVHGIVCAVEGQIRLYSHFRGPVAVVRNLPIISLFENPEPQSALDVDGFRLIYVGLILRKRGISVLMEAMRLLREQGMENVYLFLVGPETSAEYVQEIQTFARTHRLSDQIRWLGYVPHQEIKHYLANADVGMAPGLPTLQYRNPGIATKLFEYMLCGLPIITADHPHRRIYVEEGRCGLVVPAKDPSAYAEAILWLFHHPDERRAMGERGRQLVLDRYSWETEASSLQALYEQLLNRAEKL